MSPRAKMGSRAKEWAESVVPPWHPVTIDGVDMAVHWHTIAKDDIEYRHIGVADWVAHNVAVIHRERGGLIYNLDISVTRGDVRRFEIIALDECPLPITKVATLGKVPWDDLIRAARSRAAAMLRENVPICFEDLSGRPGLWYAEAGLTGSPEAAALLMELTARPRAQDRKRTAKITDAEIVGDLLNYCNWVRDGKPVSEFPMSESTLERRKHVGKHEHNQWFVPKGKNKPGGIITERGMAVLAAAKQEGSKQ